jgi:hypothetical protein
VLKERSGCCRRDRRCCRSGCRRADGRRDQPIPNLHQRAADGGADGVDYQHPGSVRKVDAQAIAGCLDAGNIVVVSPIGYSPTGEVFNLAMEDVAVATAGAVRAAKLVFLSDAAVTERDGVLRPELTADAGAAARQRLQETRAALARAVAAVRRVDAPRRPRDVDGALLIDSSRTPARAACSPPTRSSGCARRRSTTSGGSCG